jgi:hypothetical protein
MELLAAALAGTSPSRVINQNLSHHPRRYGKEMRAVSPLHIPAINQPQVCFVDQSRGLQRVASAFAPHITLGQMMQLAMDQRN